LVIAVAGACRSDELCNMLVVDVNIKDDMIVINIPTSKNGSSRKFVMMEVLWIEIVKKYLKMRPTPDMPRLFISIRDGKATSQNIGHNTIGEMPKKIARYLIYQTLGLIPATVSEELQPLY
jgi:integrase